MNKSAPPILITSVGIPVTENQNSITAGPPRPAADAGLPAHQ